MIDHSFTLQSIMEIQKTVGHLESQIRQLSDSIDKVSERRWSELRWFLAVLSATLLLLGGALISTYYRIEDKLDSLTQAHVRTDTKLEDLLARIPPTPIVPPAR